MAACASMPYQYAALEPSPGPRTSTTIWWSSTASDRDTLVERINKIPGLSCKAPRGTFYSFVNIKGTHKTSDEFAHDLLDKKQVVVVPGTAFGPGGEGYIRISYATSLEQIQKGMDLIEEYVKEYCK